MSNNINELDIFIGSRIRFFRKKMRWGLKLLSSRLGISIQQLQKYETGINKVSASMLYSIGNIFELPSMDGFFRTFDEAEKYANKDSDSFNILLIEDNIDDEFIIREAIAEIPQKTHIYSISDGTKALDFLREINNKPFHHLIKPSVVLLEMHMMKSSGLEILKSFKKDRTTNHIPVVLLTDTATPDETLSCYNLQAGGFLLKSQSNEKFKYQIYELVSYWSQLVTLPG